MFQERLNSCEISNPASLDGHPLLESIRHFGERLILIPAAEIIPTGMLVFFTGRAAFEYSLHLFTEAVTK